MLTKQEIAILRKDGEAEDSELPRVFSVLGDENRWKIFRLLMQYNDLCVTDLARVLNVSVPAVSQQLRILEMGGLVSRQRQGQKICYEIARGNSVTALVVRLVTAWRRIRGK